MKGILFLLLLLSTPVKAEQIVSMGYAHINQDLFGHIEFDMPSLLASYAIISESGVGFKVLYGQSKFVENSNAFHILYGAKITSLYSFEALYRKKIGNIGFIVGINNTNYKTDWLVDNIVPEWSGNSDSDWGYSAGLSYNPLENIDLSIIYSDIYRKTKENYGEEKTDYIALMIGYKF